MVCVPETSKTLRTPRGRSDGFRPFPSASTVALTPRSASPKTPRSLNVKSGVSSSTRLVTRSRHPPLFSVLTPLGSTFQGCPLPRTTDHPRHRTPRSRKTRSGTVGDQGRRFESEPDTVSSGLTPKTPKLPYPCPRSYSLSEEVLFLS